MSKPRNSKAACTVGPSVDTLPTPTVRSKLRALDLFCGAGGATRGLQMAGFHVTGVDLSPQPRYCGDAFVQADALTFPLEGWDFIWASPPCQGYSVSKSRPKVAKQYPMLVETMRERLEAAKAPWVIENVPGAPLWFPVCLCGGSFGLGADCEDGVRRSLRRHRLFESSVPFLGPPCQCNSVEKIGVYGNGGGWANRFSPTRRGYKGNAEEMRAAMGCDWMTIAEVSEAIPPAYAEFVGRQVVLLLQPKPEGRREGTGRRRAEIRAALKDLPCSSQIADAQAARDLSLAVPFTGLAKEKEAL